MYWASRILGEIDDPTNTNTLSVTLKLELQWNVTPQFLSCVRLVHMHKGLLPSKVLGHLLFKVFFHIRLSYI